jgi:RNA polymerase sigma factor for flagellar operon FliA
LDEEHLAQRAMPWVREVARTLSGQIRDGSDVSDLVSHGHGALARIVRRYDASISPFEGYARNRLRLAMLDVLRRHARSHRRATGLMASMLFLSDPAAAGKASGDTCTEDEMPPSEAHFRRRFVRALSDHTVAMLFGLASTDWTNTSDTVAAAAERQEQRQRLGRAIERLQDARERDIIQAVYWAGESLSDVAKRLGISKSWACRLHARGIRKLGEVLAPA